MDTVTLSGGPSTGKEGDRGGARAGLDGAAQRTPPPTPVVVASYLPLPHILILSGRQETYPIMRPAKSSLVDILFIASLVMPATSSPLHHMCDTQTPPPLMACLVHPSCFTTFTHCTICVTHKLLPFTRCVFVLRIPHGCNVS